jgi:hypothetical protein
MKRIAMVIGAFAMLAQPQTILPPNIFDPSLRRYLELSDAQVERIQANNRDLRSRQALQQFRLAELAREAEAELAKPRPDAMSVGVRYAERETICRGQTNAERETRERNRAVLSDAQRQQLDALQSAVRLTGVIGEAQAANLYRSANRPTIFDPGSGTGGIIASPVPGFADFLLGRNPGCGVGINFNALPLVLP